MNRARDSNMATPVEALSFSLNGEQIILNRVDANVTLNEWIRSQNGLTGTKKMCGEGGCGCCVVSVKRTHPVTQEPIITGINSVSGALSYLYAMCMSQCSIQGYVRGHLKCAVL